MITSLYRPLSVEKQEVRILTVQPDLTESGLVATTLDIVSLLDENCKYNAVSWCWGDATRRKQVAVDGYILEVPENADEVLREVVIRHGHSSIWLDAICINQVDIEERANQVAVMRQVYTQANKVLVWLGNDAGFAPSAIASVGKLVQHCRENTNDLAGYDSNIWMRVGKRTPRRWFSYDPLPDGVDWPAIRHIYSSPLLRRVWVIQEIALAKDPLCFYGTLPVRWRDVGIAAEWMVHRSYERNEYCGTFIRGIMNGAVICSVKRGHQDMDKLLMTSMTFDCSEPRDKVYGLLGLTEHFDEKPIIKPDYKVDIRAIFTTATKAAISKSQRLHILSSANITRAPRGYTDHQPALPSWVPPYAATWKRGPKGIRNFSEKGADNDSALMLDSSAPHNILRVQGISITHVAAAFGPLETEMLSDMRIMASLVQEMSNLILGVDSTASVLHVLYRAFTTHQASDNPDRGERHIDIRHFEAFLDDCVRRLQMDEHTPAEPAVVSESTSIILDHLRIEALHRCFYITSDGKAGQSSSVPAAGDTVCILFGSEVPLILRLIGEKYTLVGAAYLADLMDGSHIVRMSHEGTLEAASKWFDII